MPLVPKFSLNQNDSFVILKIYVPYVKVSSSEVTIDGRMVLFYCKPYLLRLNLTADIENEECKEFKAVYDPNDENGTMFLHIKKKNQNEDFPDLDLISKLLVVGNVNNDKTSESLKNSVSSSNADIPKIEIISESDNEDYNDEKEVLLCGECTSHSSDESNINIVLSQPTYGFNNQYSGVFNKLRADFAGLLEISDPDATSAMHRRVLREASEFRLWDTERYMVDFLATNPDDSDPLYTSAIEWHATWDKQYSLVKNEVNSKMSFDLSGGFNEIDNEDLKERCFRRQLLPLTLSEQYSTCYLIADILFAYCYDQRFTQGEGNVESKGALCRMSPALSWLDSFTADATFKEPISHMNVKESVEFQLVRALMRRSVIHTYIRSWTLGRMALAGMIKLLLLGRNTVLRALLCVRRVLQRDEGQGYYILNKVFLDDTCVWIQSLDHDSDILESVGRRLLEAKKVLEKEDLGFGDLEYFEKQAISMLQSGYADNEDEDEANSSSDGNSSEEYDSDDDSDDVDPKIMSQVVGAVSEKENLLDELSTIFTKLKT